MQVRGSSSQSGTSAAKRCSQDRGDGTGRSTQTDTCRLVVVITIAGMSDVRA